MRVHSDQDLCGWFRTDGSSSAQYAHNKIGGGHGARIYLIHCDQTEFGRMIEKKLEMDLLSDLNAYLLAMHNAYLLAMPKQTRGVLKFSIRGTIK